jgi:pilus assembly protein Flp/PilA
MAIGLLIYERDPLLLYWEKSNLRGSRDMKEKLMLRYIQLQNLISDEQGQDLIEYALVVALIALAATAGMQTVAKDINIAFTNIGSKLTSYTS